MLAIPSLHQLVILVLQGDDDLRELPVGVGLALEGERRAEGIDGRDDPVHLPGSDRIVDERMLGDVLDAVEERLGGGAQIIAEDATCGAARPARASAAGAAPSAAGAAAAAADRDATLEGGLAEDIFDGIDRRVRDELCHDAGDQGSRAHRLNWSRRS